MQCSLINFLSLSSLSLAHVSRLSLLLPARKAWKTFTTKLQTKLNKLHRSKAIKKPRNKVQSTRPVALRSPLSLYFHLQRRKRRLIKPSLTLHPRYYRRYLLQKRPAPVYIDDLFKHPDSDLVVTITAAEAAAATATTSQGSIMKKKNKAIDKQRNNMAGTSTSEGSKKASEKTCIMADDMWESVGLASPQMHGIDERAENFITRFRAEMELQETMARNL